jgi:alkylation response protein AidB-like acyl-CoA dehydrogenase
MNFAFEPEVESFRAEVVEFLRPWRGLDGFFAQGRCWPEVKALFRAIGQRGWLALTWPREEGGQALPLAYEYVLWDEVAYARAARNPLSAGIVAKTLLRHGTPEQRARLLPGIRAGELHFSLGYSEPEAGSDLAGLRTRAERRGDVYVVTGEKCWQSYAGDMDCLWLLARTGPRDGRSTGLTLLVVELDAVGVEVEPIPIVDDHPLYAVRLDGVEVPVANRVGPEGGAWALLGEALADERHVQFPAKRVRRDLEEVVAWARAQGLLADARVRDALADLAVRALEVEMHALRVLDALSRGRPAQAEAAANKVAHTVACQEIARAAVELGGPSALVRGARTELLWRQTLWETIGGGTSEIMRGIVARHALGLGARR